MITTTASCYGCKHFQFKDLPRPQCSKHPGMLNALEPLCVKNGSDDFCLTILEKHD